MNTEQRRAMWRTGGPKMHRFWRKVFESMLGQGVGISEARRRADVETQRQINANRRKEMSA